MHDWIGFTITGLVSGGIYAIEDWGTGYWSGHSFYPDGRRFREGGGAIDAATAPIASKFSTHQYGMVGFIKQLVDECGMMDLTNPTWGNPPQINGDFPGFWAVTRYADILEVSRQPNIFSSAKGIRVEDMKPDELCDAVIYQLGALEACARVAGSSITYVKPHGALYNTIVRHGEQAEAVADAVKKYDAKLPLLNLNKQLRFRIAGHSDERGSDEYNIALGRRRAETTKRYLTDRGIDASRIETTSFGRERPAVQGTTEEAWSKNRRAEFEIITGGDQLRAR